MMSSPIEPKKTFYKRRNEFQKWALENQDWIPVDRGMYMRWPLSKASRDVFMYLLVIADHSKPSIKDLAKACGLGNKKVLDAVHELRSYGYIVEEHFKEGRVTKTVYHLERPKQTLGSVAFEPREAQEKFVTKRAKKAQKVADEVLPGTSSNILSEDDEVLLGTSSEAHEVLPGTSYPPDEVLPRTSRGSTWNLVDSENSGTASLPDDHSSYKEDEEEKTKKKGIGNKRASAPNPKGDKFVHTPQSDIGFAKTLWVDIAKSLEGVFRPRTKGERYDVLNPWVQEKFEDGEGYENLRGFVNYAAELSVEFEQKLGKPLSIPCVTLSLDTHYKKFLLQKQKSASRPPSDPNERRYDPSDADPPATEI